MAAREVRHENISSKVTYLNQILQGKYTDVDNKSLVCRDGLLDALVVLYEECTHTNLLKNQYVADFVDKYGKTLDVVKHLRIGINDFEVKNIIGRGHFGEVEVVREKCSGDVYALKVLRKADTLAQQNVAFYEEERDIMAKATSPWLTQLQYAFQDNTNLYLVMEFHPGGDLLSLLGRYDDIFEESMARFYLAEMVLAVHALHTMGYVHRDVKPENVLIDRTGHVKLADFGSACRLLDDNSSVSNMPVGTPDYICPEVLIRMNTTQSKGKWEKNLAFRFGQECDWWSLGVCGYEMMFGKTPFTADDGSMVTTYANIMNFKKTLKFPNDADISKNAQDLIKNLLTEASRRLKYEAICVHQFFSKIDFDSIRQSHPPFIPTVMSNDDTSNFEEIEKPKAQPYSSIDSPKATGFTGKDLPFIGFTFTKSINGDRTQSLSEHVASPACKNSLERRLASKSQDLHLLREKCKNLEERESSKKNEVNRLDNELLQQNKCVQKLEVERNTLERDLAHYITECNSMKRLLELEKQKRIDGENKATRMFTEMSKQAERAQRIKDETAREEASIYFRELESEKNEILSKYENLKRELRRERKQREETQRNVNKMHGKLKQHKEISDTATTDLEAEIQVLQNKLKDSEQYWQAKLEKAMQQNQEATEMIQSLRDSKTTVEKELMELQMERSRELTVKKRLFASEEKRKSLESQIHKLAILEQRENLLQEELEDKTNQLKELAENLMILEEKLENREIEYKKCERIYAQREEQHLDKINDLEEQLHDLREQKCQLEESSILFYEDNEEKLKTIHDQENTISKMKQNMVDLEEQVTMLHNLECTPSASARKYSPRKSRRSGFSQTESPLSSPISKKPKRVSGFVQTEPTRRRSGYCQTESTEVDICSTQTSFIRSRSSSSSSSSSRSRSQSPCKVSFQIQTEPTERLSGSCQTDKYDAIEECTQTSFLQTPNKTKSPKKVSFASQTAIDVPKTSGSCQTDEIFEQSPSFRAANRSNLTLKSPQNRRSNQVQTDIVLPSDKIVSINQGQTSITVEVKVSDKRISGENGDGDLRANNSVTSDSSFDSSSVNSSIRSRDFETASKLETLQEEYSSESTKSKTVPKKVKVSARAFWPKRSVDSEFQATEEASGKEIRRKREEQISDLKQEKIYLEYKVEMLESELKEMKDGTYQQRIRALDLKQDLREVSDKMNQVERTNHFEIKIDDLKEEVTKLKVTASEATINMKSAIEKEGMMKSRLERTQAELDQIKLESRRSSTKIKEEKNECESQVKLLTTKCCRLEENECLLKKCLEETEEDLKIITKKYVEVVPRNREMESELKKLQEDKNKFRMEADKLRTELNDKTRKCDVLDQQCSKLKIVCKELESQVSDFEKLNSNYEQQETSWSKDRNAIERIVENRDGEVETLKQQLERERQLKQKAEDKRSELSKLLRSMQDSYDEETSHMRTQIDEQKMRVDILNHQLNQMEKERSLVEVDNKNLKRRYQIVQDDSYKLKEEITTLITKVSEFKNSNMKLSKNLEDAMDRYELLANQNTDLQNRIETLISNHDHEKYKMSATISQQAKLIDYLQAKVENVPKKKKGIFTGKPSEHPTHTPGIQLRELQHSLEHEREKNAGLRREITRLKDELHQSRTETLKSQTTTRKSVFSESTFSDSSCSGTNQGAYSTPNHNNCAATLTALTLSPSSQPSPGSYQENGMTVPKTPKNTGTVSRKRERMRHNIHHQFATGLNTKATKCALCLGSVLFVKVASKCEACRIVCHPKCAPQMPATCGVPIEYVRLFADTLREARTTPTMRLPVSHLNLQLKTWMKIPRSGKQIWEKRYVALRDNKLLIFESENENINPLEEMDLCPDNMEVTVHSGVSTTELTNTASSDLPYIMRIEWDPKTTCWPGRSQYFMFLNFQDKQKWVATLEALVQHRDKDERLSSAKVVGNLILSLGNRRLEVNCTLVLEHHELLVGTDEGLYLLELNGTQDARSFIHIEGVDSVALMKKIEDMDIILMVTGRERLLQTIKISKLRKIFKQNPPTINPTKVEDIITVTTFDWKMKADGLYLCVATADATSVTVLKYNQGLKKFCKRKEISIPEACACILFGEKGIIVGANKFYVMDIKTYTLTDFLDSSDNSLAFAAYGAAQYESFPISVLKVSSPDEPEEYLLCFNVFGVFVDGSGQKTREDIMKWKGLPLNFAYRKPYLFIIHYNVIQIIEVLPRESEVLQGQKTMLNLPCPRYLGPALPSGSVYIASIQDNATEILCYRGNMSQQPGSDTEVNNKENVVPVYAMPVKKTKSEKKKQPAMTDMMVGLETEFVSPEADISPPLIRDMSGSPGRRRKNSDTSTTSEDSTNSIVKSLKQNFEGQRMQYQRRKDYESYQTDYVISKGAAPRDDCHATIRTLKGVLAEQSRQRREPNMQSSSTRTESADSSF